MKGHGWDLFMQCLPVPDEAGHLWLGYLEPDNQAYDPELAKKLRPSMNAVFEEVDAYIGALRRAMPPDADLVLVSDHGMGPATWDFYPNVALRRAGLLAIDPKGQVDLAHTCAMYSFNDGGYVVVNTTDRPGGIVPPGQKGAVLDQVRKALTPLRVKTPGGEAPLVRALIRPTSAFMADYGAGGPYGGDMYLDLQPGYCFNPAVDRDTLFEPRPANATGAHGFDARRPDMHAIFYAIGPDFKRGATVPAIRTIDVAPTIARLLGIKPPAQAIGRVVTEALAAPR
jgi:predicted AlkP superfamily phosphohydrolase/phosphomutase